jgi:hypothetical protein
VGRLNQIQGWALPVKRIYFRIAADKAKTPSARAALEALAELAASYEEADDSFPERINASKAARGERPTKISPHMREHLSSLEDDRKALDDDLARQFRALSSASSVVRALHCAMSDDLPRAEKNLKHFHPADLLIGKDLVERKSQLVNGMAAFLSEHADEG